MSNRLDGIISGLQRAFGSDLDEERARQSLSNFGLLNTAIDPSLVSQKTDASFDNTDDFGTPLDWNTGPMGQVYPYFQERDRILANKNYNAFDSDFDNVEPVADTPLAEIVTDPAPTPEPAATVDPVPTPEPTATVDPVPAADTGTFNPINLKGSVIGDLYNRIDDTSKKSELITQNVKQTLGATQNLPPEEKESFLGNLFQDREKMLWLALGFNSMRLDPDDQLAKVIGKELEDIRAGKGTNQTLEHLKKYHPDVYQMVKNGMSIKDAVSVAKLKQPGGLQVGSIPKDYILKRDDKGNAYLEVIPGSATAKELAEQGKKSKMKLVSSAGKANLIGDMIDDSISILQDPDNYATGVTGAIIRDWSGPLGASTEAKNLEAKITAIKANIGFDKLQRMREESPTGGALGQVAVQELVALQATYGSLDLMQDPKEVVKTLNNVKEVYNKNMQILADTMNTPEGYSSDVLAKYGIDVSAFKGKKGGIKEDPLGIR